MALLEIEEPTPSALRWFGLPFALSFALLGAVLLWRTQASTTLVYGLWGGAACVLALYYALPPTRRAIYLGWIYAAYPLGFVLSHVAMAVVYYLVITPIALVSRTVRPDRMQRKTDPRAQSHWHTRPGPRDPGSYFRQF